VRSFGCSFLTMGLSLLSDRVPYQDPRLEPEVHRHHWSRRRRLTSRMVNSKTRHSYRRTLTLLLLPRSLFNTNFFTPCRSGACVGRSGPYTILHELLLVKVSILGP
jgi:hypothetical protein